MTGQQRTLVIGDIHGGYKALTQVLEFAKVTTDDRLIFLGDYVDGWSESSHVIDLLIHLNEKQSCLFIKGNHDDLFLKWLQDKTDNPLWIQHGGQATIDNYNQVDKKTVQKHLNFLQSLKNYHVDAKNRLFVHAGFTSLHGPEKEYNNIPFYWDRTLWETAVCLDTSLPLDSPKYPQRLKLFNEIYIGHTPTLRIGVQTPVQAANVWNMDTGAAFTGSLTLMDINTKEFWQSDPLPQLYPTEKGRN